MTEEKIDQEFRLKVDEKRTKAKLIEETKTN